MWRYWEWDCCFFFGLVVWEEEGRSVKVCLGLICSEAERFNLRFMFALFLNAGISELRYEFLLSVTSLSVLILVSDPVFFKSRFLLLKSIVAILDPPFVDAIVLESPKLVLYLADKQHDLSKLVG